MSLSLSIDTGGTHTDLVLIDDEAGRVATLKVPTTPHDLCAGVTNGIRRILDANGRRLSDVNRFVYGTTLVTNLIIEHADLPVGLITTRNFRDILEIGRAYRPEKLYDLRWHPPKPLVPRHARLGVPERIDARGAVVEPLDEAETRRVLRQLADQGVKSIAVCLLNAYVNPVHEQRIAELARAECPEVRTSLSSNIIREFREFERSSTTVVNAFVQLPLNDHLDTLEAALARDGLATRPFIIRANGGIMSFRAARDMPIALTHSGPMGGIVGAASIAAKSGIGDLITLDMGGTSTDVSLIADGKPVVTTQSSIADHPVKLPTLDLLTIGAGGGSIAWADPAGALKVGPKSAGATPGPACYGNGGTEPTITDANLVTGRLNPNYFLAGAERLQPDLAREAIGRLAKTVGLPPRETALGILEIAEAHMVNAIKLASIKRGLDPRDMTLVAFGGAGPLHAARLAEALDIRRVISPWAPGNLSALGMLDADIRHDFVLSRVTELDSMPPGALSDTLRELVEDGAAWLEREGVEAGRRKLIASADLRYTGQNHELNLPLTSRGNDDVDIRDLIEAFHRHHEQVFGYCVRERTIQLVNLRVAAIGGLDHAAWPTWEPANTPPRPVAERAVLSGSNAEEIHAVYRFDDLRPQHTLSGPAIVEYAGSTLLLPTGWRGTLDEFRNVHMTR